jgi:hypothetical protein
MIGSPNVWAHWAKSAYVTPSFQRGTEWCYTPFLMGTPGCPALSACLAIDMAHVHLAVHPSVTVLRLGPQCSGQPAWTLSTSSSSSSGCNSNTSSSCQGSAGPCARREQVWLSQIFALARPDQDRDKARMNCVHKSLLVTVVLR